MIHISKITVSKAQTSDKDTDAMGAIFIQVWLTVFTWILASAFGKG
jgi:hypothetical protein